MINPYPVGRYEVEQIGGKKLFRQDFDSEEWSYEWMTRGNIAVLRLLHSRDPQSDEISMPFVEFSTPVSIRFVSEE